MKKNIRNRIAISAAAFCAISLGLLLGFSIEKSGSDNLPLTIVLVALLSLIIIAAGVALFRLLNRLNGVQKKLDKMAYYDFLTDLPNRRFLLEFFNGIEETEQKESFALFFIDIDNFKLVNDNEGHSVGDVLLIKTAEKLQKLVLGDNKARLGTGVASAVVRFGGDEFILVVPSIESKKDAALYARHILNNFLGEGIDEFVKKYEIGLSIGVAFYPYHSDNCMTLLKFADESMYFAKRQGKNGYHIHDEYMPVQPLEPANEQLETSD